MELETLATQLSGEVWHTGGGCMAVKVVRGHWTLIIGLEPENEGWDFDFDDEYVDSKTFDEQIDFNGSNYAEVIEAEFVQLNDPISRKAMGF
tara:strand:- start:149 stop:424 length:276 start_codon:yes stop_codon:yes gene_type:complete